MRLSARLRPDILKIETHDGLDLVDLIRERITSLDPDEARALDLDPDEDLDAELLQMRLSDAEVLEDAGSDEIRRSAWAGRKVRGVAAFSSRTQPASGPWELATTLPAFIAETWRQPERWRRLAEDHAAGTRYLHLPGLLTEVAARRISSEVLDLQQTRLTTDLVDADRHLLGPSDVPTWLDLMQSPPLIALVGAVLARPIPGGLVVNAWRLTRGDHMGVHPDGRFYAATLSLGLCEGWTASDGGAIAFGVPRESGLEVRQRFIPHLGDACLFAPDGATWHAVEAVNTDRIRRSLTGWWVEEEHGLTRGAERSR
jgi:hypothetical protein